jgi:hypothetical protein
VCQWRAATLLNVLIQRILKGGSSISYVVSMRSCFSYQVHQIPQRAFLGVRMESKMDASNVALDRY